MKVYFSYKFVINFLCQVYSFIQISSKIVRLGLGLDAIEKEEEEGDFFFFGRNNWFLVGCAFVDLGCSFDNYSRKTHLQTLKIR